MAESEEAELERGRKRHSPRYTMSSREIDDWHRPRILRPLPDDPTSARISRHGIVIRRLVLSVAALTGAALGAGAFLWATLPSPPPQEVASSSAARDAAPHPGAAPRADTLATSAAQEGAAGPAIIAPSAGDGPVPARAAYAPAADARWRTPVVSEGGPAAGNPSSTAPDDSPPAEPGRAAPKKSPHVPRVVVQLSSFYDQRHAREAAAEIERSLRSILKGTPIGTERATVQGKEVWRVVAGPVASRDHGKRLCDAVRNAGRSCIVILL